MGKMISGRITVLLHSVVAIVVLLVGLYGLTRPLSYGCDYYHAVFYEGDDFNGTMTFYSDNTVVIRNTNFDEDIKFFYYYKNGYVFFGLSQTEEEFENEVAAINEDFEGAVNTPFYASEINAFRLSSEGLDGYKSVYLCQTSLVMALVWGATELVLLGIVLSSANRCKKEKCEA